MAIDTPNQLANVLRREPALYGAVLQSLTEFEPLIAHSGTPFFPEYTDHGPQHLVDVINTASSLIRDEAWATVTSADAAVLLIACLLHDSGMHLTEDGFVSLLSGNRRTLAGWSEATWPELWQEFLGIASRFDARELVRIFGSAEPIKPPGDDPQIWTLRDRQLIGEFIRRHHARLAHEIAIEGFPGPGASALHLKGLSPDICDLSRLIARSHGSPIRSMLPYLTRYNPREYKGVHAPFIMSLLRVADYLQVQSERAPTQVLSIRKLRSPVSAREWKAHHAVRDIRHTHEDPEAVFIDAAPNDVSTFLRLQKLISGLQAELDACWAVLGEVYGRYQGLRDLGLTLRRVRSNLDDIRQFARTVPYVPSHASFDSAGPDLLKLLVKPLYGDRPEIGIRELVQNSVDACRELSDYLQLQPSATNLDFLAQDADVVVQFEDRGKGGYWLRVSDRGIGMTPEVVSGYFLKAGASFRRSDAWRKLHEDRFHRSRVLKSGRFGIGVLAAFLLGDEVEVSTRHVTALPEEGVTFSATIDMEDIELRRFERPIGTTIAIRISSETWQTLFSAARNANGRTWDWYCLSDPSVRQVVIPTGGKLKQQFTVPSCQADLPPEWRRISHPDYKDIQWSYWEFPSLSCNGIRITTEREDRELSGGPPDPESPHWLENNLALKVPSVSVFDPDGHLPLVLQRNALATDELPFEKELLDDVVRDWIAFALVSAPTQPFGIGEPEVYARWYPGITMASPWNKLSDNGMTPYVATGKGLVMADSWHISKVAHHRVLFVGADESLISTTPALLADFPQDIIVPVRSVGGIQQYRKWIRFGLCHMVDEEFSHLMHLGVSCKRMVISRPEYDRIKQGKIIAAFLWSDVRVETQNDRWVSLVNGFCNCGDKMNFPEICEKTDFSKDDVVLIEWHLSSDQKGVSSLSPLAQAYRSVVGDPIIPYDSVQRRKGLAHAYEALKPYIAAHEQLLAKEKDNKREKKAFQNAGVRSDEDFEVDPFLF